MIANQLATYLRQSCLTDTRKHPVILKASVIDHTTSPAYIIDCWKLFTSMRTDCQICANISPCKLPERISTLCFSVMRADVVFAQLVFFVCYMKQHLSEVHLPSTRRSHSKHDYMWYISDTLYCLLWEYWLAPWMFRTAAVHAIGRRCAWYCSFKYRPCYSACFEVLFERFPAQHDRQACIY